MEPTSVLRIRRQISRSAPWTRLPSTVARQPQQVAAPASLTSTKGWRSPQQFHRPLHLPRRRLDRGRSSYQRQARSRLRGTVSGGISMNHPSTNATTVSNSTSTRPAPRLLPNLIYPRRQGPVRGTPRQRLWVTGVRLCRSPRTLHGLTAAPALTTLFVHSNRPAL